MTFAPGDREQLLLAPYATASTGSRGRAIAEPAPSYRSEFQRDRDRIIHSKAFRRLEYKTQVFVNHEGDLFRTRLTHTLEVAQIARTVARTLALNEDLVEAIALAHDLGHTPFGHAGQEALNGCMREYGGFEHNLQSLRVVDVLEQRYADFDGLNLTFETREGILKRCSRRQARDLGELGRRFLEGGQPSLEAQLTNVADEIAYNSHDVDDGLRAGLISVEQLRSVPLTARLFDEVDRAQADLDPRRRVYEVVRHMIGIQVADLVETSSARLADAAPRNLGAVRSRAQPLIGFSDEMQADHKALKQFLFHNLYRHYRVYRMAEKSKGVVRYLFDAFFRDPALMPPEKRAAAAGMERSEGPAGRARPVADYVAGMTDRYAIDEYRRLSDPLQLT